MVICGAAVPVLIDEPTSQRVHRATSQEKANLKLYGAIHAPAYDYIPSGQLRIRSTSDRPIIPAGKVPLEERINEALIALIKLAMAVRESARQREAWEQRREADRISREERIRIAEARRQSAERLERQADNWGRAQEIREFVRAAKDHLGEGASPDLDRWAAWALAHADEIDPFSDGEAALVKNIPGDGT